MESAFEQTNTRTDTESIDEACFLSLEVKSIVDESTNESISRVFSLQAAATDIPPVCDNFMVKFNDDKNQ